MESIRIEILNPKVKKILQNLADLNLIRMQEKDDISSLKNLFTRLRSDEKNTPSMDEITSAVEEERARRYGIKN